MYILIFSRCEQCAAKQLKDGTILVIGRYGRDDVQGKADEAVVQQTFRLDMRPEKAKP